MTEKKREFEIRLKRVVLPLQLVSDKTTSHLVTCRVLWPSVGTSEREASLMIDLDKREWNAYDGHPWSERILMKASAQGNFALEVSISEPLSDAEAANAGRAITGSFLKILAAFVEKVVVPEGAGGLAALPFSAIAKTVQEKSELKMLLSGVIDLTCEALPPSGEMVEFSVPFKTANAIYKETRRTIKGNDKIFRKKIFEKGSLLGECFIEIFGL